MLDLLLKYAEREGLVAEPGFAPKDVKWALDFNSDGGYAGVLPLGDTSAKKNPGRKFAKCPDFPANFMNAGGRAHFLVESLEVVTRFVKEGHNEDDLAKLDKKRQFFLGMLKDVMQAVPVFSFGADGTQPHENSSVDEIVLKRVVKGLENEATLKQIMADLASFKPAGNEKVALRVNGHFLVDSPSWHAWWRDYRMTQISKEDVSRKTRQTKDCILPQNHVPMVCYATGSRVTPLLSHDKVKGLGTPEPSLIGFDKDAFKSLGLESSANAAVSAEAAAAYRAALNHLIEHTRAKLADATVVHWFKDKIPPEDDVLVWLEEDDSTLALNAQQRAAELLRSVQDGRRPDLAGNTYYALTLSSAGGRVMVRDFMTGSFPVLVQNVDSWFQDLSIARYDGTALARTPGIERVITSLLAPRKPEQKYPDWMKPVGAERVQLLRAALVNAPIPFAVMARIVDQHRTYTVTGALEAAVRDGRDAGQVISLLHARMGLLKAFHNRRDRGGYQMGSYLNEDHPSPAYHCGRLMAVYARLQNAAQGDVNAGVVQRYYAAASSTPGLVLGRLARLSQFHLNKLETGLSRWYEKKLADIWACIAGDLPTTLGLAEQSLFALGYYQQMAADWPKSKNNASQPQEKEESTNV